MGGNGSKVETPVPRNEARIQGSPEAQEWVEACAQKTFDWVLDEMKPDPKHDLKYVARAAIAHCACTYPHMQLIIDAGGTQKEADAIADGPCGGTKQALVDSFQALTPNPAVQQRSRYQKDNE